MCTEPEPIAEPAAVSEEKEEIQTVDTTVEDKIEDKLKDKPEELPVIVIGEAFRTYIIVQQGRASFLSTSTQRMRECCSTNLLKTIPSVPLRCF